MKKLFNNKKNTKKLKIQVNRKFVLSGDRQASQGVKTMDIAKRLLDFGVHAPTTTPVSRLDEVRAAREMNIRYRW